MRDGNTAALDNGQVESLWVTEQLSRPVVKEWNAILAGSFTTKPTAADDPNRIASPVAADTATTAPSASLVEDTGFAGLDAGTLADSWRQQPGTPAYCTQLGVADLAEALAQLTRTKHRWSATTSWSSSGPFPQRRRWTR